MTYDKVHRFFLRTVASQGVLSITDAQTILEKFGDDGDVSVNDLVKAINSEIKPFQQEIKITTDEVTNEQVVVFLSLGFNEATKSQNLFSATELEYFRILMEQIMTTESRQITGIHAVNLVSTMTSNFTKTDAQKVLNTWCRMRYLDKEENNYALGVRAIHEFEGYIRQNMPDTVEDCFLCKKIVFRGYNCPGCAHATHTRCLKRYLENVAKWPCCKIDFSENQLEQLNNQGSRLPNTTNQTQSTDVTQEPEENNTVVEPTQSQECTENMDITEQLVPEISQRVTRKRKRQISPEVQHTRATHLSARNNSVTEPTQARTSKDSIKKGSKKDEPKPKALVPVEKSVTRRSTRKMR